ncbi:MAG: hypothetical protein HY895_20680 [Deltaproteobacteria bacterium]|nr:hypothetical protein [Deltaproteobacteria bacterium]
MLTIILYHSVVKGKIFMMFITLFLFSTLPGDGLPFQTAQPEPAVIGFYDHPVRMDEEDQKRFLYWNSLL